MIELTRMPGHYGAEYGHGLTRTEVHVPTDCRTCLAEKPLSAAIFAARELAWQPHVNLSDRKRYAHRNELHRRVVDALTKVGTLSANGSPELRYLVAAIYRVASCSWANRKGAAYYERKQAVAELRGCLLAYDRARELAE